MSCYDSFASQALARLIRLVRSDHALASFILSTCSKSFNTVPVEAKTKSLLRSTKSHKVLSYVVHDIKLMELHLFNKQVFKAFVTSELAPIEVFAAYLALNHDLRTVTFYVHE